MRTERYKTKAGELIIEYLKLHADKGVSATEISDYLEMKGETANITTVYRRLDKLINDKRVISHSSEDGKKTLFQYVEENAGCLQHIHFQCTKCSKIVHLDCVESKEFTEHLEREHGLKIDYSKTIFYGLCKDCITN